MTNKKNIVKLELTTEEKAETLKAVIKKLKEDLMTAIVQEWIFSLEYAHPQHITKAKALENMGIYQSRIQYLKEQIYVTEKYAEDHEIVIK